MPDGIVIIPDGIVALSDGLALFTAHAGVLAYVNAVLFIAFVQKAARIAVLILHNLERGLHADQIAT